MSFLIDTDVIFELRKGAACDSAVSAWFESVPAGELRLSVLVLGEIRKGVDSVRHRDPGRVRALEAWLERTAAAFDQRMLSVDLPVALEWGRLSALRPLSTIDGLLAATARIHGLTLVTRDERAVAGLGAKVLNPWKWPGPGGRA